MTRPQLPLKFRDFLENFVDEHSEEDCDELLLDVTPQEVQDLGVFFVRGICGWMHNLRRERVRQKIAGIDTDVTESGFDGEGEAEEDRELVQ